MFVVKTSLNGMFTEISVYRAMDVGRLFSGSHGSWVIASNSLPEFSVEISGLGV